MGDAPEDKIQFDSLQQAEAYLHTKWHPNSSNCLLKAQYSNRTDRHDNRNVEIQFKKDHF